MSFHATMRVARARVPRCRHFGLGLVAAASFSCSEGTAPVHAPGSFGFINGPGEPGNSGVFRVHDEFVSIVRDDDAGLASVVGWSHSVADLCDGIGAADLMDIQLKPHNAGEFNSLVVDRDATVQIFVVGPDDRLCLNMRDASPLYAGTARFHRTDNNLTETGTEGGRANSFGWTVMGTLTNQVTGVLVDYHETVRFVSNPKTDEFFAKVIAIRIDE